MEMTTVKTVAVFAIIFGCFAVLYPKIFHPMLLHVLGLNQQSPTVAGMNPPEPRAHMPQHLRADMPGKLHPSRDSNPRRGGPHPGMRAAAEMKKQAAGQHGQGGGKGMMGVVLPMYAIGIVLYLVYTMAKVMTRKDATSSSSSKSDDYLGDHFSDVRRSTGDQRGGGDQFARGGREDVDNLTMAQKVVRQQKDLEKLLLHADKENISAVEMSELKRKLLETEAQMTRILKAMEAVQEKVSSVSNDVPPTSHDYVNPTQQSNKEQCASKIRSSNNIADYSSGYTQAADDDDTDLDEEEEEEVYDEYENPCNDELPVTKGHTIKKHVTVANDPSDNWDEREDTEVTELADSSAIKLNHNGPVQVSEKQEAEKKEEMLTRSQGVEKQHEERKGNKKKRNKEASNNRRIQNQNEIISREQRSKEEGEIFVCSDDNKECEVCSTEPCGMSKEELDSQASKETTSSARKKELRRRVARREM